MKLLKIGDRVDVSLELLDGVITAVFLEGAVMTESDLIKAGVEYSDKLYRYLVNEALNETSYIIRRDADNGNTLASVYGVDMMRRIFCKLNEE